MFSLLFFCQIVLYWEKVTSYEKSSHNFTLEVLPHPTPYQITPDTKQKHVCWKFIKSEGFWLCCGNTLFLASFYWLWYLLLENMKLKKNSDDIHWNIWTNIKTLYAHNNIFKKKRIPNMRFLNHLYYGQNFVFLGTAWERFSSSANHGGRHFCSANKNSKK